MLAVLLALPCAEAGAQPITQPIGPYVVDARGTLARFKGDGTVGAALGVEADALPGRGLGLAAGAHWYPARVGRVTIGLGGEVVLARDSRTADASAANPQPLTVTTRFSAVSPHLSLNFGSGSGWSYLSGGIGLARLTSERDTLPFAGDSGRVRALHYGGGARWFNTPRLAFTFDLRFYTIGAQEVAVGRPAYPRTRFMAISVGVSVR